jgi:hypothetical protein
MGYDTVKAILQFTVGVKVNIHTFLINQLYTWHSNSQGAHFPWKDA